MPRPSLPLDALLSRQLHMVTGKGGVGKSTLACALAVHFMNRGERVLLAQVNAKDSHSQMLGLAGIPDDLHHVSDKLCVVNVSPEQSLRQYAMMHLKFEAVYKTVFENRLTKAFMRFIPSMAQLNMMGKLWFHAEEREDGRLRFDKVIIDAPATGHALDLLRVARVVNDVAGRGPMADDTRKMQETLADPERSALHVVTLAEEMPANETEELLAKAEMEKLMPLGLVVVNQLREQLFDDATRDWLGAIDVDGEAAGLVGVAQRRAAREQLEQKYSNRLSEDHLQVPRVDFPFIPQAPFSRAQLDVLAARLTQEREARP